MVIEDSKNVSAKMPYTYFSYFFDFVYQVKQHDTADAFKDQTEANEAREK